MRMESSGRNRHAGYYPFDGMPAAPFAVPRFIRTSSWDFFRGREIRSSLLIFPEMFQVLLDREMLKCLR
jgi:hypothetical protein